MSVWNAIKWIARNAHYFLIILTVGYVAIQSFLDNAFPSLSRIPNYFLASIGLAAMAAFALHFDGRLNQLLRRGEPLKNATIEDSIKLAAEALDNKIDELKVFAITTEVIHPIVRNGPFSVNKCKVMLHKFNEAGPIEHSTELNAHNLQITQRWEELKNQGVIRELEVVYYEDRPFDYIVVLDDRILVQGYYVYKDDSIHGNLFEKPVLVRPEGVESQILIEKAAKRFDDIWNYWKGKGVQL